jgi:hypothetical protein
MLTNKLTQLLAITGLFTVAACGEDKDDEGTTNAQTITVGDDGSESGSASMTDASATMTTMTDPSATMTDTDPSATVTDTDPTAGSESGGECPAGSECMSAADCDFGVQCVDCMCEGGDSTGTPGDDPYPEPNPGCPPGYGSIDPMQAGGGVCAPPCEAMFTCPEPTSGTAMGACALVEPGASMDPCETAGEACPTDPEICLMFADGTFCSNPPAWCFLSCMGGAVCPDGQMCGPQMICVWPE